MTVLKILLILRLQSKLQSTPLMPDKIYLSLGVCFINKTYKTVQAQFLIFNMPYAIIMVHCKESVGGVYE